MSTLMVELTVEVPISDETARTGDLAAVADAVRAEAERRLMASTDVQVRDWWLQAATS